MSVLAVGGFSENVSAPGGGAGISARVRQWRRARLDVDLSGAQFFPDAAERACLLIRAECDTRELRRYGTAAALLSVGPGGSSGRTGGYASAGLGAYVAGGDGCAGAGCDRGVRQLGLQWTAGAGTRFRVAGLGATTGARVTSLEAVTATRAPLLILHLGLTP